MRRTTSSRKTRRSSKPIAPRTRKSSRGRRAAAPLAYLGLGSNVGDRRAHLEAALREIAAFAAVRRVSSFYRTEPVGFPDQPDFWNAAVEISWAGTPGELLAAVRRVERRVGRTPTFVNGPREIDVDILDLGGKVRTGRDPMLPHPRLAGRRFALVPLAEIRPDWIDPRSGIGIAQLLARLPSSPRVRKIGRVRPESLNSGQA
ncbi:MAG: 2-amino-4-hydroxy-6-hydroxymethyldihydropteridine diphosphokinase [Acidobacteriota bacterium]|nr:2-amino-4-hydroxy-6-hydroxymethyldihydropteridine diphosphokinase [Acidobacteriota bacterium]MDQ5872511.1 2-amino-4-hydroxy-6-hydroxymethyldihydropteridine diphosphokinase [Acidobacteriota bacterium]